MDDPGIRMNSWKKVRVLPMDGKCVGRWCQIVPALLCFALFPVAAQHQAPEEMMARIERAQPGADRPLAGIAIEEILKNARVPGLSVVVIQDFRIHWAKTYGLADVRSGRRVVVETLFQAASISKPVTALATLRLVQDGKLSLDEDVNRYLKSWQVPRNEFTSETAVTLRSLLSHTSGSDDGFGFPGYSPGAPLPTLVQILKGEKPSNTGPVIWKRHPFVAAKYSGGGIVLEQLLLQDRTGKAFANLMKDLVLSPLGMAQSTFEQPIPPARDKEAARAHDEDGRAMEASWHVYPEQAAAGLWTTPSDLARAAIELQNALAGRPTHFLKRPTALEMVAPLGVGGFAVGFSIEKRGEGWYFSHSGGNWGFRCILRAHFRKGYGLVIMTNGDNGGTVLTEVAARIEQAYKWDSLDKPLPR
jgi:CubicO group peptidase (beta-lactamase class C family)